MRKFKVRTINQNMINNLLTECRNNISALCMNYKRNQHLSKSQKKLKLFIKHPEFRIQNFLIFFLILLLFGSCMNPFAPKLVEGKQSIITDQKYINGVFDNFRYAYIFRDTTVYGKLLTNDFTFTYRNYERNVDVTWGRDEDMLTTSGLFSAAQSVDLTWNEIVVAIGDSSTMDISRGFSLTVIFDPTYTEQVQGRASLRLVRKSPGDIWQISRWLDESNF